MPKAVSEMIRCAATGCFFVVGHRTEKDNYIFSETIIENGNYFHSEECVEKFLAEKEQESDGSEGEAW